MVTGRRDGKELNSCSEEDAEGDLQADTLWVLRERKRFSGLSVQEEHRREKFDSYTRIRCWHRRGLGI